MNPELIDVLSRLGVCDLDNRNAWARLLLVNNHGHVPNAAGPFAKGFKLLVLDGGRRPSWFARCSWADAESIRREVEVLRSIEKSSAAAAVPECHFFSTPRISVLLTRYVGSGTYQMRIHDLSPAEWRRNVEDILLTTEALMASVANDSPLARQRANESARCSDIVRTLDALRMAGVPTPTIQMLETILSQSLGLPYVLQHGDLWPANVIYSPKKLWLIDFAECGLIWQPAFDLLHMLCSGPDTANKPWFACTSSLTPCGWTNARLASVQWYSRRMSLTEREMGIALVCYLAHLAARRLVPGAPRTFVNPLLTELKRVCAFLSREGTIAEIFRPAALLPA